MKRNLTKSSLGSVSKQNEIDSLKQQVFQLKDLEYDIFRLNDEIASIEAKYGMVLDEKDRTQNALKSKIAISKNSLQELQTDVETIKSQITIVSLDVNNLTRDNAALQRSCDNKETEIINLSVSMRELEKNNQTKMFDLKATEEALQNIKQNKLRIEEQCQRLSRRLTEAKESNKELDKETKNQLVIENSLSSTLENLKLEGGDLMSEMKVRENVLKETSIQYENLCGQANQCEEMNQKLEKECKGLQQIYGQLSKTLESYQRENMEKCQKLKGLQNTAVKAEEELSKSVLKRDCLMKEHSDLATKNKDLNLEIDDCLMKILQMEAVNKSMQKHIEEYIACDEEARMLLDRKQKMTQLLQTIGSKLSKTESAIAHLM